MKQVYILLAVIQTALPAMAQHQEMPGRPELWKDREIETEDTTSILHAFKKGQVHGHFRYFFMATDNKTGLSDYHAHAVGGGIKYETAPFKGVQFGVSGFFVFNIGSSDLSRPDPKTNQHNRYELALFDMQDAFNKSNIDRLEELYLKYGWKQSSVTFGRQLVNTPFINLQDGRMWPTEVSGLYAEINDIKNTQIEGGFINRVSPRSTTQWYKVGESIGLYPQGVNPDGQKSGYAGNLESKGIGMLGITRKYGNNFSAKLYNVFVENIFNALLLQADYSFPLKNKSKCTAAVQFIREDAVNNGGNANPSKTYFSKGGKAQAFGAQLGWEHNRWQTSINYNRITAHGRYLSPREWGRDPFFTFLPRERNDGLGNVHAVLLKTGYTMPKLRVKAYAALGYYSLPEVTDFVLNKYGMPAYTQFNIDMRFEFGKLLQGMEAQWLFVYKGKSGSSFGNDKYVINKVDVSLWNIVINYHF